MIDQTVLSLYVVWPHLGFAPTRATENSQQGAAIAFRSGQNDRSYSTPLTIRRSRTAPSPSAFKASAYAGLSYAAVAFSKLGYSTTTVRSLTPCSRATAALPRARNEPRKERPPGPRARHR